MGPGTSSKDRHSDTHTEKAEENKESAKETENRSGQQDAKSQSDLSESKSEIQEKSNDGNTESALSEDQILHKNGEQTEAGSRILNDIEIKVNSDAEYFRQKNEESDEKKPTQHEKLSLLDKLMGKKKTLL